jgi:arylsulfatase A
MNHTSLGLFSAAVLGVIATSYVAAAPPPNLVYILADDLGYGDLGCYGQTTLPTPHLDALAAAGMRFTQHYAGNSVCSPSRSSLLTGLHPGHVTHRANFRFVESYGFLPGQKTFADVLRDAGYGTGIAGKWHVGDRADTHDMAPYHGFDYSVCVGYPYPDLGREHWPSHVFTNGRETQIPQNAGGKPVRYMDEIYTEAAERFLSTHRDRPFIFYLAFQSVHAPMDAAISPIYANRPWPRAEKVYASMVERVDENVGRLLADLGRLSLADNTIVFFSSDNGPHHEGGHDAHFFRSSGLLRGGKRDLYEGGIRVPLLVRWPGVISAHSQSDQVCAFWDMLPTFAELGGAAAPKNLDGISFAPTLRGEHQPQHDYLYWENQENGGHQAVRRGDWKAVRLNVQEDENSPIELYNLASDPGELHDVARQYPEVVRTMAALMAASHVASPRAPLYPRERAARTVAEAVPPGTIRVDPSVVLRGFGGNPLGINLNYLRDSTALRPAGSAPLKQALRDLGATWLRYPGGEKSDAYFFGPPPFDKSDPVTFGQYRRYVKHSLGFDEFAETAQHLAATPYLVVGYDSAAKTGKTEAEYLAHAVAWVRYANVTLHLGIKYWDIGNENWNNHTTTAVEMARIAGEFARAMKQVDPSIKVGTNANGRQWAETLINRAGGDLDFISYSNYFNAPGYLNYVQKPNHDLIPTGRTIAAAIARSQYHGKLSVIAAEFGAADFRRNAAGPLWEGNDLGHALVLFDMMGQFLREPTIESAMFWTTRWMDDDQPVRRCYALGVHNEILPVGEPLRFWNSFRKKQMVQITAPNGLRAFATFDPPTQALGVLLINPGLSPCSAQVQAAHFPPASVHSSSRTFSGDAGPTDVAPKWRELAGDTPPAGCIWAGILPPYSATAIDSAPP